MKHIVPDSALSEAIAIVGRTGSGKSYAARGLVERVLDAEQRVCVLDPTGVWHGLRKSADELGGCDVVIFGGDHADLPLTEGNAAAVARLVAGERISSVLDLADMTMGARTRLATAFADELYRANKQPLVLVADEADLFAPQRAMPDQTLMLSRFEQIARRGRVRGFRLWCITQRPAELHKSVLSQASTLIAMKLTAPQDRDAIGAWIEGQADKAQGKQMLATLPKLKVGEGFVWCPAQDILDRVSFPRIKTLDTMRAPEPGETPADGKAAAVDVDRLRAVLGPLEDELAENDPRALRARIKELERAQRAPAVDVVDVVEVGKQEYDRGRSDGQRQTIERIRPALHAAQESLSRLNELLVLETVGHLTPVRDYASLPPSQVKHPVQVAALAPRANAAPASDLPKAERLILTALAQAKRARTAQQVAIVTGYSHSGGGFRNACGALRTKGYVAGDNAAIEITAEGLAALGAYQRLPTGAALLAHWGNELGKCERKVLEALAQAHPVTLTPQQIANRAGYEAEGGGFRNALGKLRTLELISGYREVRIAQELIG